MVRQGWTCVQAVLLASLLACASHATVLAGAHETGTLGVATYPASETWNDISLPYAARRRAAIEAGIFVHSGQVGLAALAREDSMRGYRADPPPAFAPSVVANPERIPPPSVTAGAPPLAAASVLGGLGFIATIIMAMAQRPRY
jgi:hypothetical protein